MSAWHFSAWDERRTTSIDVKRGVLTDEMAQDLILHTLTNSNRFHDTILTVVYGGIEPAAAMEAFNKAAE